MDSRGHNYLEAHNPPKDPNEICYETGEYTDECVCEICDHRFDCSGYEGDDWDE